MAPKTVRKFESKLRTKKLKLKKQLDKRVMKIAGKLRKEFNRYAADLEKCLLLSRKRRLMLRKRRLLGSDGDDNKTVVPSEGQAGQSIEDNTNDAVVPEEAPSFGLIGDASNDEPIDGIDFKPVVSLNSKEDQSFKVLDVTILPNYSPFNEPAANALNNIDAMRILLQQHWNLSLENMENDVSMSEAPTERLIESSDGNTDTAEEAHEGVGSFDDYL